MMMVTNKGVLISLAIKLDYARNINQVDINKGPLIKVNGPVIKKVH